MKSKTQSALSLSLMIGLLVLAACAKNAAAPIVATAAKQTTNPNSTSTTDTTQTGSNTDVATDQNGRITESADRDINDPTGYVYSCKGTVFSPGDKSKNNLQAVNINIGDDSITFKKVIYQDTTHEIFLKNDKGNLSLYTLNGDESHQESFASVNLGANMVIMDGFSMLNTLEVEFESMITCNKVSNPKTGSNAISTNNGSTNTTDQTSGESTVTTNPTDATQTSDVSGDDVKTKKRIDPTAPKDQNYSCHVTLMNYDQTDSNANDITAPLSSADVRQSRLMVSNGSYKVMLISDLGHIQLEVVRKNGHGRKLGGAKTDFGSAGLNMGVRNREVEARAECTVSN